MGYRRLGTVVLILGSLLLVSSCGGDGDAVETLEDAVQGTNGGDTAGAETGSDTIGAEIDAPFGFDLDPVAGSEVSGQLTITPTGEQETDVEIVLDGEGAEGSHPAHIHEGSSCDEFNPEPAYPLNDVQDGTSATTLDVGAADLLDGEYVVNVHESTDQLDTYIACGKIPSRDEVIQGS